MTLTYIIFGLISAVIFFAIAELFGRAKHIGRWWTFFLLFGTFILPGLIALMLSPSAMLSPTKKNIVLETIGWVVIALIGFPGLIFLVTASYPIFTFNLALSGFLIGSYLIQLGQGNLINKNPKIYIKSNHSNIINDYNKTRSVISDKTINSNNFTYFLIEGDKQSPPYSFDQLKKKGIGEDELVWRKGFKNWVKANEVNELESIIIHTPPPIPASSIGFIQQEAETPPPIEIYSDGNKNKPEYVNLENEVEGRNTGIIEVLKPIIIIFGILIILLLILLS